MEYPSKAIEDVVNELSTLPGIGRKTALRLAFHLLRQKEASAQSLGKAISELHEHTHYCQKCQNISDADICKICSNPRRNQELLCVVEDAKDVIALESTHQFTGVYHVLGGLINPLQGIGPSVLNIDSLLERVKNDQIKEVIFALSSNIEGDTTTFYVSKKLAPLGVQVSSIARGIPVGTDLEFTDEVTLARSLINRTRLAMPGGE